jgi:hypothetical protein
VRAAKHNKRSVVSGGTSTRFSAYARSITVSIIVFVFGYLRPDGDQTGELAISITVAVTVLRPVPVPAQTILLERKYGHPTRVRNQGWVA